MAIHNGSGIDPRYGEGVAIVIGGSGGIGQAICEALAQDGSDVVLTYRRNKARADAAAARVQAHGRKAEAAPIAVENPEKLKPFVDDVARRHGRIHSVVYAAGPEIHMRRINQLTPGEWAAAINADVNGCFNLVWATLPHLKAHGDGSLVALITAAVERVPSQDILSASPKAAIEMLIRGVAKEEGRHGIRANCVGPGWIAAGLGKAVLDNEFPPEHVERIRKSIPLRQFGQPEDVAAAVAFLNSSRARFITGQSIAVDGGGQL